MPDATLHAEFTQVILASLEETFENVQGMYLDRNTSIFETLANISAEEASIPTSANCASIAAHVEHMRFYMDIILRIVQGEKPQVDWSEIWRTVQVVNAEEWATSQANLRQTYNQIRNLAQNAQAWNEQNAMQGAVSILMHNAYHLGEIRHALCTLKS